MILGGALGFYFVLFEKLLQVFYLYPDNKASAWVKQYIKARNFKDFKSFISYLYQTDFSGINRSIINSFLFHLAWVVVAIFTVTSTNVSFGRGLVMGLGFGLLLNAWQKYQTSWEVMRSQTFWQIKRVVSNTETKYYLYFITGLFLLLTILFV